AIVLGGRRRRCQRRLALYELRFALAAIGQRRVAACCKQRRAQVGIPDLRFDVIDAVVDRKRLRIVLARKAGDELQMRNVLQKHERRDGLARIAVPTKLTERKLDESLVLDGRRKSSDELGLLVWRRGHVLPVDLSKSDCRHAVIFSISHSHASSSRALAVLAMAISRYFNSFSTFSGGSILRRVVSTASSSTAACARLKPSQALCVSRCTIAHAKRGR